MSAAKIATLQSYKDQLSETLQNLLDAEEKIKNATDVSSEKNVEVVKQMYYEHEVIM